MTTLNREITLSIAGDMPGGIDALIEGRKSVAPSSRPTLMAGDACTLKLLFRARDLIQNGASTPLSLAVGSTIIVTAKTQSGSDELFRCDGFVESGTGDDLGYSAYLDLGTSAVTAATAALTNEKSVDIYVDVETRNSSNTERLTYRVAAKLYKEIYTSGLAPSTLSRSYLQSPSGFIFQIGMSDNGEMSLTRIDPDQRGAGTLTMSYADMASPGGYYFRLTVDDEGALKIERIQ